MAQLWKRQHCCVWVGGCMHSLLSGAAPLHGGTWLCIQDVARGSRQVACGQAACPSISTFIVPYPVQVRVWTDFQIFPVSRLTVPCPPATEQWKESCFCVWGLNSVSGGGCGPTWLVDAFGCLDYSELRLSIRCSHSWIEVTLSHTTHSSLSTMTLRLCASSALSVDSSSAVQPRRSWVGFWTHNHQLQTPPLLSGSLT